MQVLAEVALGQPPITLSMDELRAAIVAGRMHHLARVSLDGGQSWDAAWHAAGLPPPAQAPQPTAPGDDAAMRMLIPVGRSVWAIVAGYLAIPTLLADFVWLPVALGAKATAGEIAQAGGVSLLFLGVPQVVAGILGQRAIRRDPKKHGMGRIIFAYVCVGLLLLAILMGIARGLAQ